MRKTAIQVALVVAGLGLLFAPFALGSNMGFKLERNLNAVSGSQSFYLMSFPFYRSFNDLWNSGTGALGADGNVMSDDVLADWFTGGDGTCDGGTDCNGSITLLFFDNTCPGPTCNQFVGQTMYYDSFANAPAITGTAYDVLQTGTPADQPKGFVAQILSPGAFPVIIVGSENPDITTWHVNFVTGSQSFYPFSMLYHTTWTTSQEVLDAAWAGQPDPVNTHDLVISILDFSNVCPGPNCNQFYGQTIAWDAFNGVPLTTGNPFNLVPGNGYMFQLVASSTTLTLPHY